MDSVCDIDLLGELVLQVRVSARTLALLGFFIVQYIYIYIKKNWRAAGLELTTKAPSRTIVTDGNC